MTLLRRSFELGGNKFMRRKISFLSMAVLTFVSGVFLTYVFYYPPIVPPPSKTEIEIKEAENVNTPAKLDASNIEPREIKLNQDIRLIDFNNFTYNWFPKNETVFKKRIVLRDGANKKVHLEGKRHGPLGEDYQEQLVNVSYADLTGDGKEEAVVTVGVSFYRWLPMCIYVFSEKNKKAVQIWKYETSTYDNTDLEFRGLRIEDGDLVIEEFKIGTAAACCAESVVRKTLAWNGKTFEPKSLQTFPWNKAVKDFKGFPSEKY
jgi:hypothetical protein